MSNYSFTVEPTSNNTILKFVSPKITVQGSFEFNNIDDAKNAPLAQQLFYLPFVKKVYMTANFIAIERFDIVNWQDVQEEVKEQIETFLNNGGKLLINQKNTPKKVATEVYAESTPNPTTMKFVANKHLVKKPYEFRNMEEAKNAPLAMALFNFPFVKDVFISENYISVSKLDTVAWDTITIELRSFIRNYLAEGKEIISENSTATISEEKQTIETENIDGISKKIIDILEEYVKPAVASDGGNIAFKSFNKDTKTLEVILQGACSGCPSSTITLKNGIESILKELLPNQINNVIAFNG